MKNIGIEINVPAVFFFRDGENLLVPSMIASTVLTCALITFIPQLMPLWMQLASATPK